MTRSRARATIAALLVGAGLVVACQHDVQTPFASGLSSIDLDAGPVEDAASYTETLDLQQGTDSVSDYANATGYVLAPIEQVWAAMKDPNVVVDRHGITSYTSAQNVEKGYDVSFATYCHVSNVISLDFTLTWREGVVQGTEAAPTGVSVDYQKTDGSSLIDLQEGTIGLLQVTPSVTKMEFNQRMSATDTGPDNISSWTKEMYASVLATVHGQPLP